MSTERLVNEILEAELVKLPAGTRLYRGSIKKRRCNDPDNKRLTGVPSFAFDKDYALSYASRNSRLPHPNHEEFVEGDRSVLFSATLRSACTLIVLPQIAKLFSQAYPERGDYFQFEKEEFFPLARRARDDDSIAGYIGTADIYEATEVILDLDLARITVDAVEFL